MKRFLKRTIPFRTAILVVALIGLIGVGATYAVLTKDTSTLTNSFTAQTLDIKTKIHEDTSGTTKQVLVSNENTTPVFIRAKIVVSPTGAATASTLLGTDHTSSYGGTIQLGSNTYKTAAGYWVQVGDWYYYLGVVPQNYSTGLLMNSWSLTNSTYSGNVDIYVYEESVQTTINASATQENVVSAFTNP